jgi:hypothetical protein
METLVSLRYIVRLLWHLSPIHNNPKIPISPHHHVNMYADSSCQKNKNFTTSHHLGSFFYSLATDLEENGYCKIEELLPQLEK